MALSKFGPGHHDWVGEMNRLIRSKGIPYVVLKDVVADGNCWYHTIVVFLNDSYFNRGINARARGITSIMEFRFKLAHFMETDPTLHASPAFILQRDVTLANENLSWEAYLARVRTQYKDADELVTLCTALFIGKNIMQVSNTNTPEHPWSHIAGPDPAESWPAATAPDLTIGYLNMRHYMPLRKEPSTTHESQCVARNTRSSKSHCTESSVQLANLEEFPPLPTRGTPSTPRKRVSKPSHPKGDPPSTPSKQMCKLSLTGNDPPSTPSKRASESLLPQGPDQPQRSGFFRH